jgi:hypothetical protein
MHHGQQVKGSYFKYHTLSFFPYSVPLSSTNSDSLKLPDQ